MAANIRTEMRIPTRTAPRPPVGAIARRANVWGSTNDIFAAGLMSQPVQKKKPPPRPPPPKFNHSNAQYHRDQKHKKPARPTELLTNFFGRKSAKNERSGFVNRSAVHVSSTTAQSSMTDGVISLIDLSPPGSPTFTTRSSSDGVSIDSFGSDGNSNPSAFTSSGNTSQAESTFEDDFDFFGMSTKKIVQNDPWQMKPDPFGPLDHQKSRVSQNVKQIGDSCFFAFNTDNGVRNQVPFGRSYMKPAQSMPTIIRPRPPKPPAPKVLQKKMESMSCAANEKLSAAVNSNISSGAKVLFTESASIDLASAWGDNDEDEATKDNDSPPMPTIPPPAPPPEYLAELNEEIVGNREKPYGIALYDFPATHLDDLALKEGDIVTLIKVVNTDWMEGRVRNRQGMFPTNFIDIKVPLPEADNVVIALYSFKAETTDDLSFEEGAKITVLSRLSEDWLYGEFDGREGQFPANFVNRIPSNLPESF